MTRNVAETDLVPSIREATTMPTRDGRSLVGLSPSGARSECAHGIHMRLGAAASRRPQAMCSVLRQWVLL
jgi:hypothetical protein